MPQLTETEYNQLLRDSQAPWQKDGFGVQGPPSASSTFIGAPDLPAPSSLPTVPGTRDPDRIIVRPPVTTDPVAPSLTPLSVPAASIDINTYSFKMVDATGDPNNPIKPPGRAILIYDGQVSSNGDAPQFPSGMGNDDFYLQITGDGYKVWCEIAYDTTTLAITSSNISQGAVIPTSTLGDAFVLLGSITIEPDGTLTPHNTQCGDINIDLIYGALNGALALFLVSQIDVPQLVPP